MKRKLLATAASAVVAGGAAWAVTGIIGPSEPTSPGEIRIARDGTPESAGTVTPRGVAAGDPIANSVPPPNCASAAPPSGYVQAYADEFDGTALNTGDWYYRITGQYSGGYNRAENVSTANGALRLRYGYEDVTGDGQPERTGGGIMSRSNFGYGYYQVCAKLFTATSGLHTAFWSMGVRHDISGAGGDPRINQDIDAGLQPENNQLYEIDGFEHDSPDSLGLGDVVQSSGTTQHRYPFSPGSTYGVNYADWNLYAYEYTPTSTKFYINGTLRFTIDNTTNGYVFTPQTFWLTALPMPASFNSAALPGYSEFDFFRFYRKPLIGANLIGNGSFDAEPNNAFHLWNPPGWIENYDRPASYLVGDDHYNGKYALIQTGTSAYQVTTKQNLKYLPNGSYRLTARVKSSGGQPEAVMRVLNFGGPELRQTLPTTNSWTLITIDGISVTNGQATIAFTSTAGANQWIKVDDVQFVQTS